MNSQGIVCTGCGCLCDDILLEVEGERLGRMENVCAKGAAYLGSAGNAERRARSLIAGREVSLDQAIEEAGQLLSEADKCLIFGLDNSTLQAQVAGIELARKLGGVIDDASSFSFGNLIQNTVNGELPTCFLSEVKDNADLLLYWGSNPTHTHPRHLSKYTYLAYTDFDPAGWLPRGVRLSCVEVRDTEFSSMCRPSFKIDPCGDEAFIRAILDPEQGGTEETRAFADLIAKSSFCVLFCGSGLCYSVDGDFGSFNEMVNRLGQSTRMAVIPMVGESNMRGFNETLNRKSGFVDRVSFAEGVSQGAEFSFLEQVRNQIPDCVLIVGADPFSALPQTLMANLQDVDIICLDSFSTPTTEAADVVVPVALPGLECEGSVLRMDGDEVALVAPLKGEYPGDEEVIRRLTESIS
ncbi:hypothetical protein ACFLXE_01415 [Chloroflexota bacterium]